MSLDNNTAGGIESSIGGSATVATPETPVAPVRLFYRLSNDAPFAFTRSSWSARRPRST
jgi:hypothetical protein